MTTTYSLTFIDLPAAKRKEIDDFYRLMESKNHYQVLAASYHWKLPEIRAAYFKLVKAFHPDKFFRKEIGSYRKKLERITERVGMAYEVLSKDQSRKDYDMQLFTTGQW